MTFEFECPNKHVTEKFCMPADVESVECPDCGLTATKALTAPQAILWSWRPDQIRNMGKGLGK